MLNDFLHSGCINSIFNIHHEKENNKKEEGEAKNYCCRDDIKLKLILILKDMLLHFICDNHLQLP